MNLQELLKLNGGFVNVDELAEVETLEEVELVECCGFSGGHIGYIWYRVYLFDGRKIDLHSR